MQYKASRSQVQTMVTGMVTGYTGAFPVLGLGFFQVFRPDI